MKMSIDKFLVIVMTMIALMIPAVAGYYGGICHAIRDSKASYQDGVITLELDGQIYEHFVEQMRD